MISSVIREFDVPLDGGRTLHAYDAGPADGKVVFWHHGTPNIGTPPEPLFETSDRLGLRWVSYDRPGYGGSTSVPGRTVGTAGDYASAVADHLGLERFALMGHSGGGTHAIAAAALLPERVVAVAGMANVAPFDADGLDFFAGMGPTSSASLRAAAAGRPVKEAHEASDDEPAPDFTEGDWAALDSDWSWFGTIVRPAVVHGPGPLIDDDLAYVAPWGCDPGQVRAPALLVHGGADRSIPSAHSEWLAKRCPASELWIRPDDGHISVIRAGREALEWLARQFT